MTTVKSTQKTRLSIDIAAHPREKLRLHAVRIVARGDEATQGRAGSLAATATGAIARGVAAAGA